MWVTRMCQHLISLNRNNHSISHGLGLFQVADVPWVNDVEVAITEHTLLPPKQIREVVNVGEIPDFLLR